ncbi:unnamed protein product, partial [Mesorhabditis spiculigera]
MFGPPDLQGFSRFQQSMQQALSMAQQANQFERQHVLRPGDVMGSAPTPPSYSYTSAFSNPAHSYTYTSTSSGPNTARNSGNQTIVVVTNIPDEDDADLWKYRVAINYLRERKRSLRIFL